MKFTTYFLSIVALLLYYHSTHAQIRTITSAEDSAKVNEYMKKAFGVPLFSHIRDKYLDSALAILPSYAYLWQQKSNPTVKQRKYEIAIQYLDSAVKYDNKRYLDYRGFTKCIFQKSYCAAIDDFMSARKLNGNSFVMDHSYDFWIGLSYLQLNQFDSADFYITKSIEIKIKKPGPDWVHPTEWFYHGIVQYEKENYVKAIESFDYCLKLYKNFADPKYYKASCLEKLEQEETAIALYKEANEDLKNGNRFTEDSQPYEQFPYQIKDYWIDGDIKRLEKKIAGMK